MTNISAGGALIVVPTYLPRGTQIELEIPTGTPVPAGRVTARVTKVQMVDREPRYGVGCVSRTPSARWCRPCGFGMRKGLRS